MKIRSGTIINGRFEITGRLGEGGFAEVFHARDLELAREVAIKILKEADAEDIARFNREAIILARLKHENIVSIFAYGIIDESIPYLVMELLPGRSLRAVLNESKRLNSQQITLLTEQLCRGVDCAHSAGIVHRDLSPENIFLIGTQDNLLAKLLDFGLSNFRFGEAAAADKKLTTTGTLMGNPFYMSPEMAETSKQIDSRSDIYSLGCILYECVSGARPFSADSPLGTIYMHKQIYPKEPELDWEDARLRDKFKLAILRCLQKDPEKRFQTCVEILEFLSADNPNHPVGLDTWSDANDLQPAKRALHLSYILVCVILAIIIGSVAYMNGHTAKFSRLTKSVDRIDHPSIGLHAIDIRSRLQELVNTASGTRAKQIIQIKELESLIPKVRKKRNYLYAVYMALANKYYTLQDARSWTAPEITMYQPEIPGYCLKEEKYLKAALECCTLGNGQYFQEAQQCFQHFSFFYWQQKKFKLVELYSKEAIKWHEKILREPEMPQIDSLVEFTLFQIKNIPYECNMRLAQLALLQQDLVLARKYATAALDFRPQMGFNWGGEAEAQICLADIALHAGDKKLALSWMAKFTKQSLVDNKKEEYALESHLMHSGAIVQLDPGSPKFDYLQALIMSAKWYCAHDFSELARKDLLEAQQLVSQFQKPNASKLNRSEFDTLRLQRFEQLISEELAKASKSTNQNGKHARTVKPFSVADLDLECRI